MLFFSAAPQLEQEPCCESRYWVRWPLRATGPKLPAQRDTTGRSVVGRLDLERSRSGAASESDRMSAARVLWSGQNVWGGKVVSPEQTMCPVVVYGMSLAD